MTAIKESRPDKDLALSRTEFTGSLLAISLHSFGLILNKHVSPLKGLIEKSCIMESNPELYLKMREHTSMENYDNIDDDNISIED